MTKKTGKWLNSSCTLLNKQSIRFASIDAEQAKRSEYVAGRAIQRMQLHSRKVARKMLQYASSQSLNKSQGTHTLKVACNSSLTLEIARDEILNYKDPGRASASVINPSTIYNYKDNTIKQLRGLFRPNIIKNDKSIFIATGSCL